jgi:hypothetical protein
MFVLIVSLQNRAQSFIAFILVGMHLHNFVSLAYRANPENIYGLRTLYRCMLYIAHMHGIHIC